MKSGRDGYVEVGRKDPSKPAKRPSMERILRIFLRVQDSLNGEEIDLDILDGLLASEDLDAEIEKVPVGYALMTSLAAYAEERRDNLKLQIKKIYGELDDKARDGEIVGRPTDAKVKAWIEKHPLYLKMCKKLNSYNRQMLIFQGAAEAFEIKTKMIQTKSANNRFLNNFDPNNPSRYKDLGRKKKNREEREDD